MNFERITFPMHTLQNVLRNAARRTQACLICKLSKLSKSTISRFTSLVCASWK